MNAEPCPSWSEANTACTKDDGHPLPHRDKDGSEWVPYDPDYDNCAGVPSCGNERVHIKHYGLEQTICPRCYANVFGAEPDPSSVHRIAREYIPGLGDAS